MFQLLACQVRLNIEQFQQSLSWMLPSLGRHSFHTTNTTDTSLRTLESPEDKILRQKVGQIAMMNLKEHDINICACQDCIYRKQLNRRQNISLDLSKHSSYQKNYGSRKQYANQRDLTISYEKLGNKGANMSAVVGDSSYGQAYAKEQRYEKPKKARPVDELKFKGPTKNLSGYGEDYPTFTNNASPYVKPIEVSIPSNIKFNSKSIYQKDFAGVVKERTESGKRPDNLRSGKPWVGDSTYRKGYQLPAPPQPIREDLSRSSRTSSVTMDPNYKHQYQSSYRSNYLLANHKAKHSREEEEANPVLRALKMSLD